MKGILFVDAGNYSRSPAAEIIARAVFASRPALASVRVGSAGLKDKHVGGGADPRTIAVCAPRGHDLESFRCRQIGPADFDAFDLILAMDRSNLAALLAMKPIGTAANIDLLIPNAEVPDPYFGGEDGFVAAVDAMEARIHQLADELSRR